MDQETDAITRHIDNERDHLTRNLKELESSFRNATDIRGKFNKNPFIGLGVAFAGGFLLSVLVDSRRSATRSHAGASSFVKRSAAPMSKLSSTLNNILEAFAGLASEKIESFMGDAVPGFHEQYKKVDRSA